MCYLNDPCNPYQHWLLLYISYFSIFYLFIQPPLLSSENCEAWTVTKVIATTDHVLLTLKQLVYCRLQLLINIHDIRIEIQSIHPASYPQLIVITSYPNNTNRRSHMPLETIYLRETFLYPKLAFSNTPHAHLIPHA